VNAPHPPGQELLLADRTVFVRRGAASHQGRRPAVLVHGLGGQSTNWTDFVVEMGTELDEWAPDLPGFGWSPPPDDADYSVRADTEVVAALVDDLYESSGQRVHLFGNSMGGAVSVMVAASRPDRVATLTLISPALPDLRPRRDTLGVPLVAIPRFGQRVYTRLTRVPPERQVQGMVALNYGDAASFTSQRRAEAIREVQRRLALPYAGEALSGAARSLLRSFIDPGPGGLWSAAGRITCPTLVLYGGRDRLVDPRRARRAARHLPQAQIVTLPRVGHVAQMEDPALVARFVRPMVVAQDATSAASAV
jgi:pimeloyl-ACP methyl ester carboxylesterase